MNRKITLRDAQKAQTRQRMLEAARSVFHLHGYYGATVDQIVAEAGASRPTFYLHFRDKEEVLGELMSLYMARAVPCMKRLPEPRPTVDELKEWLFEVGAFLQQERALFSVLTEVSAHGQASGPHYGLATMDAWITALSDRSPAFAAASNKKVPDINARARAQLLIIEMVWAGANVATNRDSPFTQETVAIVASSLHDFVNDSRFHSKQKKLPRSSDATRRPAAKARGAVRSH